MTEFYYGNARGVAGYEAWHVSVIALGTPSQAAMPAGPLTVQGSKIDQLGRAQAAVWSPDGAQLAVVLPQGWRPDLPNQSFGGEGPGDVWRWTPGSAPSERLVENVDFATPLLWVK